MAARRRERQALISADQRSKKDSMGPRQRQRHKEKDSARDDNKHFIETLENIDIMGLHSIKDSNVTELGMRRQSTRKKPSARSGEEKRVETRENPHRRDNDAMKPWNWMRCWQLHPINSSLIAQFYLQIL